MQQPLRVRGGLPEGDLGPLHRRDEPRLHPLLSGPREIEARLEAPAFADLERAPGLLAAVGCWLGEEERLFLADHYLDTADLLLRRAGWTLRLRDLGTRRLLTLKACRPPRADGLAEREEFEEPTEWAPVHGWRLPPAALGGRVAELTAGEPLERLFELRQERRLRPAGRGGLVCELSLDRVEWRHRGAAARAALVELELRRGGPEELAALADELAAAAGWRPAPRSKFERGLALAGLLD
ncbi:MAG: CYTH domain-containing protein [Planctomycetota bacterium]|nr:MAG: CYTH domain-containing protein [Planctomycetota bacterium]